MTRDDEVCIIRALINGGTRVSSPGSCLEATPPEEGMVLMDSERRPRNCPPLRRLLESRGAGSPPPRPIEVFIFRRFKRGGDALCFANSCVRLSSSSDIFYLSFLS